MNEIVNICLSKGLPKSLVLASDGRSMINHGHRSYWILSEKSPQKRLITRVVSIFFKGLTYIHIVGIFYVFFSWMMIIQGLRNFLKTLKTHEHKSINY